MSYASRISKIGLDPNLSEHYRLGAAKSISQAAKIAREADNTIRSQQQILNGLAEMLGVAEGDVDGLIEAVEELKTDAERYRWLRDGCSEKTGLATDIAKNYYGFEWNAKIDKALAAGEAG